MNIEMNPEVDWHEEGKTQVLTACCSLLVFFFLWLLHPVNTLMSVSFGLFYVKCRSDILVLTLVCVLANSVFGSSLCLTFWYFDPCLHSDSDSCLALNKSLFHFTPVCIWVLPLHLSFTIVTIVSSYCGLKINQDKNILQICSFLAVV